MLKKHMAACLVASAFMTMPVLAQTSTSPGAAQPATGSSGGASSSGASTSGSASGHFITQQQQNQWRASKLIGVNVYGSNNERIGDVNEVLVDRQGNADAVVVGVGGFLGIGEKNVALPFNAFEWQMEDTRRTASAGGTGGSGSSAGSAGAARSTSGDTAGAGGPGTTATTGAGTGASGAGGANTTASTSSAGGSSSGSSRSSNADRGYPDHAVLRMSKADIQNAPTFRYVGDRSTDNNSSSGANRTSGSGSSGGSGSGAGGTSTAPRQ
jgi:sporulation protein YlmC with PRC-barrel domain